MIEKCIECEESYNHKSGHCQRCELDFALNELKEALKETRLYRFLVKCVEWLDRKL